MALGKEQADAFQKSKSQLSSDVLLVHFDPGRKLAISCDASPYGIGPEQSCHMFMWTARTDQLPMPLGLLLLLSKSTRRLKKKVWRWCGV